MIGHTLDPFGERIRTYQRKSLIPLKCIGIVQEIDGKETSNKEERFIQRLMRSHGHHNETYWYTDESKKIINAYLKEYMTKSDIKMMSNINKEFKEIWNGKMLKIPKKKQEYIDKEPALECRHCGKLFGLYEIKKLNEHEKDHSNIRKKRLTYERYECRFCKEMMYEKELRWHDKHCPEKSDDIIEGRYYTIGENLINCEYCDKYFLTEASLRSHLKFCKNNLNREIKEFVCKECGKVCCSYSGLISHSRVHKKKIKIII